MSIRSRYTKRIIRAPPAPAPAPTAAPKKNGIQLKDIASKAAIAAKTFVKYVEDNQKEYIRQTGDTSLEEDLRNIPIRVCRTAGNTGKDDFASYLGGYPVKKRVVHPPEYAEFRVKINPKPKPKPKPKYKVVYLPRDWDAKVG